jgi:acyl-CoA thioester hydrolase
MARCLEAGFGIMVRRHQIEYQRQAVLDDELEVSTWVSDFRQTNAIRHYLIRSAASKELIARLRSLYVWVDLNAQALIPVPEDFREAFAANVVS